MPQNLIEKIAQRFAEGLEPGHVVRSGDYVSIRPAHVLTHDNTSAVMPKFAALGADRVADPRQPVFALDHDIQNRDEANLAKYARIEAFARQHGVDFYPAGRGIGHQVMCEEGYAWPGTLVVASDSHANMYGGLGCLGTPVVRSDAAALWATGRTWWQVPPVARVTLAGRLAPGATGKDVIITLCALFNEDQVLNHALEFAGEGVAHLSIEERLTIANMTTEWGALAGVFPVDERTIGWLRGRVRDGHPRLTAARVDALAAGPVGADAGAACARTITLDLTTVQPYVSGPNSVRMARPAAALAREGVAIQKAYLLSCVNGRTDDLAAAARVLAGRRVAPGVTLYVAAASSEVQAESERRGDWAALLAAGAVPLPPGCGPCIGLGQGTLADGEVGISATNRNFKGRMGAPSAQVYLASPAVVAASAAAGRIAAPEGVAAPADGPAGTVEVAGAPAAARAPVAILDGLPPRLAGGLLFCPQDNLNTDGIYAGKYTYRDDLTPADQAAVVMENYDPGFRQLVRAGDLLVGGFNFGTGSSREQAATALKHAGIQAVLAGSFNETYKRNALNNGLLVIEAPALVRALKARFGADRRTVRTGIDAEIDIAASAVRAGGETYAIDPIGSVAQALVRAGGLDGWVKESLAPGATKA
jgi:homoaconitate hydratase